MAEDNWRELLDDVEVRRIVTHAVRTEGARVYPASRDALLRDDLEPHLWDESVNVAIRAEGFEPGIDRWYAYLYASLKIAAQHHRRAVQGAPASYKRDGEWRTGSLDALTAGAPTNRSYGEALASAERGGPNYLFTRRLNPNDPLGHLLYLERLEDHVRRASTTSTSHSSESAGVCADPMCTAAPVARGLCRLHYHRHMALWGQNLCNEPECGLPVVARGLCSSHYSAARRRLTGTWSAERAARPTVCTVPDCGRPHIAKGYCGKHWKQWRRGKL